MKNKAKNRMKKLGVAVLAICMLVVSQLSMAFAADSASGVVDFGQGEASITIQGNDGQSLAGKTWKLHRLFDVENAEGMESVQYTFHETYKASLQQVVAGKLNPAKEAAEVTEYEVIDYMQSLNAHVVEGADAVQELEGSYSDYRYFVEELTAQFLADGITGEVINVLDTTTDNCVVLTGLPYGYYIIEDVTAVKGEHTAASMCIVTTANPETTMKVKSDYPTVTKKIQEDDGEIGWNDIGDYEIGQLITYKYESVVPNMNGYSKYYYAWHDVMDEALTLQPSSVVITISGTVDGVEKEYQLTKGQFSVMTDLGGQETFLIEIDDLKWVVDGAFPQMNELSENIYGQKVTLTYQAVLNEKAAEDTGRPGFENDVRLEFSNNPNATGAGQSGLTPWDTVVCFTYRLDGVKVNNYGAALKNAKFKLYYDKDCTQEVFVKEIEDGYCVIHTDSLASQESADMAEICSDENGEFTIYGLDSGTYYLLETEAPAGYRPITEPIEIQITPTFPEDRDSYVKGTGNTDDVLQLSAKATITTFVDGEEVVEEKSLNTVNESGSVSLTVVNEVGAKLPITGSYLMPVLFVIGAGCLITAVKFGKKKYE